MVKLQFTAIDPGRISVDNDCNHLILNDLRNKLIHRQRHSTNPETTVNMKVHLLLFVALAASLSEAQAQDWAIRHLEASPRHQEWVPVKYGDRTVQCFVVYPEVSKRVPVIVLIHENRGLDDWARSMADQVAEAGFIAVAPDLLSGLAPGGGKTSDFANSDEAREALYTLSPDQVIADLDAVFEYAAVIPAASGTVAVGGFCWGGSQTFRYATRNNRIAAALVFYGTAPDDAEALGNISAPVYGFYGGNDQRVNATIAGTESAMKAVNKIYDYLIYDGAGHGFMRSGQQPGALEANQQARDEAMKRLVALLAALP
jgi:carboxymethylenebutenolidase